MTDQGKIYGVYRQREIKQRLNEDGYPTVTLGKNPVRTAYRVHRLVAIHFVPNPEGKPEVNHKNFDRTDVRAENLEWVDHADNVVYSYTFNLDNIKGCRAGSKNGRSKITEDDVRDIRKAYADGEGCEVIAKRYPVTITTIQSIVDNRTWTHI